MNHAIIAERAGVYLGDLDYLASGKASANVANRLGVSIGDIESFINGSASAAMAARLGFDRNLSAADELARVKGSEGAIGVIFGLLLSS